MRLPIPPPPQGALLDRTVFYFFGAGAGVTGAGAIPIFGCVNDFFPFTSSDAPPPAPRVAKIDSDIDVNIKTIAEIVVALDRSVADPRGPNAVWDPIPPKAPAKSAALPLCSSTTTIKKRHTRTCTIVNRMITTLLVYPHLLSLVESASLRHLR